MLFSFGSSLEELSSSCSEGRPCRFIQLGHRRLVSDAPGRLHGRTRRDHGGERDPTGLQRGDGNGPDRSHRDHGAQGHAGSLRGTRKVRFRLGPTVRLPHQHGRPVPENDFRPVLGEATDKDVAVIAIKAIARGRWQGGETIFDLVRTNRRTQNRIGVEANAISGAGRHPFPPVRL